VHGIGQTPDPFDLNLHYINITGDDFFGFGPIGRLIVQRQSSRLSYRRSVINSVSDLDTATPARFRTVGNKSHRFSEENGKKRAEVHTLANSGQYPTHLGIDS
jgi:hypothetical protein